MQLSLIVDRGHKGLDAQLYNRNGSSQTCSPLDCLKKWQLDHTGYRAYILSQSEIQRACKVKSEVKSAGWHVIMFEIHLQRLLWVCCFEQ